MKKNLKLTDLAVKSFITGNEDDVKGGVTTTNEAYCETLPCTTYTDAAGCTNLPTDQLNCSNFC